jgi:late competence protein required for DNA uptake (superfamily II DNA/RNA helicase)
MSVTVANTKWCIGCKGWTRFGRDGRCFDCGKTQKEWALRKGTTADIIRYCVQLAKDREDITLSQYQKVKRYNKDKVKW